MRIKHVLFEYLTLYVCVCVWCEMDFTYFFWGMGLREGLIQLRLNINLICS